MPRAKERLTMKVISDKVIILVSIFIQIRCHYSRLEYLVITTLKGIVLSKKLLVRNLRMMDLLHQSQITKHI